MMQGQWVTASFEVEYKVIDEMEAVDLTETVRCHATCDRLGIPSPTEDIPNELKSAREMEQIPSYILSMWNALDRKLDAIIHLASQEQHHLPNAETALVTEVSKAGLKLKTAGKVSKGNILYLRISPPSFPRIVVDAVGLVIEDTEENNGSLCTLTFEAINPDDRELIIGFIFKRQREILRGKQEE